MSAAWLSALAAVTAILLTILGRVWSIGNTIGGISQWMKDHERWHDRDDNPPTQIRRQARR